MSFFGSDYSGIHTKNAEKHHANLMFFIRPVTNDGP